MNNQDNNDKVMNIMIQIRQLATKAKEIEITTESGMKLVFLSTGATLRSWKTADNTEIVAGYLMHEDYLDPGMYLGTTVGPLAGRIKNGEFDFLGKHYRMDDINPHFLHSGKYGFSFQEFAVDVKQETGDVMKIGFSLEYRHPVLPGEMQVSVDYTIKGNELGITYMVKATDSCLCNLTNHSYFNLEGTFDQDIRDHYLEIESDKVVMVDDEVLGSDIIDVASTPFDFRHPKNVFEAATSPELKRLVTNGIDNYFLLRENRDHDLILYSRKSRKRLTIRSTYPGITVYTTNFPNQKHLQNGKPLAMHGAIAMEPHFQSNAINDRRFAGYILPAEKTYQHKIIYLLEEDI